MKVVVHHGSVLSLLVFAIVVDVVMENVRNGKTKVVVNGADASKLMMDY